MSEECTKLWESIVISTVTSIVCVVVVVLVYAKLCRKIEQHAYKHHGRRQPGFRAKKPNNALAGNALAGNMPSSQLELPSPWPRNPSQAQQGQGPHFQIDSFMAGSSSESSLCSLARKHALPVLQHSGSDEINYTTIVFQDPMNGTSSGRSNEDLSDHRHYENVSS
ncbi:Hypothetical predicted protein [Podarcis lilfordi]|uniref:Uncharacterized protein n=1 Tax=Podarcis lilfordi TaxID=74358 RepID=A0AA35P7D0_9SAUR|nr:Hypothetical predicted protein [Podarcis lilfordi]